LELSLNKAPNELVFRLRDASRSLVNGEGRKPQLFGRPIIKFPKTRFEVRHVSSAVEDGYRIARRHSRELGFQIRNHFLIPPDDQDIQELLELRRQPSHLRGIALNSGCAAIFDRDQHATGVWTIVGAGGVNNFFHAS